MIKRSVESGERIASLSTLALPLQSSPGVKPENQKIWGSYK